MRIKLLFLPVTLLMVSSCSKTYVNLFNNPSEKYPVDINEIDFYCASDIKENLDKLVANFNIYTFRNFDYQDSMISEIKTFAKDKGGNKIIIDTFKINSWSGKFYASGRIFFTPFPKRQKYLCFVKSSKNLSEMVSGINYEFKGVKEKLLINRVYKIELQDAMVNELYFNGRKQDLSLFDTNKSLYLRPFIPSPPPGMGGGISISINISKKYLYKESQN